MADIKTHITAEGKARWQSLSNMTLPNSPHLKLHYIRRHFIFPLVKDHKMSLQNCKEDVFTSTLLCVHIVRFFKNSVVSNCEVREKTNEMQQLDVYLNNFSTCFGHHYAHLQENKTCVTACGVLRWFCWMWLVAVVGTLPCRVWVLWRLWCTVTET